MKKSLSILAAVAVILGISFAIPALSATSVKTISGCVSKKTGILRIAKSCKSWENKISWNAQGIKGETGLQGLAGPGGSSAVNFANNCFQHLNQAEAVGFIWSIPSNVSRFESLTGCTVREIDLNPNSQVPGFYPNFAPQILRAKLVGLQGGGGEGSSTDSAFFFNFRSIYEVTLTKPAGTEVCSLRESARVFESPETGKTYVVGRTSGSQRGATTNLAVGGGPIATEIQTETNRSITSNGVTTSWYYARDDGPLEIQFEDFPTAMPLGSTYELKIKSVSTDSEEISPEDLQIQGDGGLLAGLRHEENQPGYAAIYTLTANDLERGISELSFTISNVNQGTYGTVILDTHVGVQSCFGPSSDLNLDEYDSNLYRIIETDPIPDFFDSIAEDFEESVGWTSYRWFELDPTDFPD